LEEKVLRIGKFPTLNIVNYFDCCRDFKLAYDKKGNVTKSFWSEKGPSKGTIISFYGCRPNCKDVVKFKIEESTIGKIRAGWLLAKKPDGTASIWDFIRHADLECTKARGPLCDNDIFETFPKDALSPRISPTEKTKIKAEEHKTSAAELTAQTASKPPRADQKTKDRWYSYCFKRRLHPASVSDIGL
jgi:hypothetical protein